MIKPNKIIITCGLAVMMPFLLMGVNIASASEVTGTINSDGSVTTSTTTGSITGGVGSQNNGSINGSVGTTSSDGTLSGTVTSGNSGSISGTVTGGSGGTISGTVTGGTTGGGGGGNGGGGGGGNGPISTNIPNNGGGGIVLGTSTNNTNNPGGGLVLGVSTSTVPEFPTTGFGPNNIPQGFILLTLLVAVPIVSLSTYSQSRRKKFMRERRINEFSIDDSIFS